MRYIGISICDHVAIRSAHMCVCQIYVSPILAQKTYASWIELALGTAEGIQSASLPSSSTLASEAAPMTDTDKEVGNYTADAHSRCYYDAAFHDGAAVKPAFAVRMKSKATPRWRHVCVECCHWMTTDSLLIEWHELCFSVGNS